MATPLKDVLVVGLGAVGTIYSYILQNSGLARATAVARSNYNAVREHGMNIQSQKYGNVSAWRPDRLVSSVAEAADRPYSYVVLTTKAIPEIVRTPSILASFLSAPYTEVHRQPTYVLLQNGMGVERDLYSSIQRLGQGDPRIISTVVWIGVNLASKSQVIHNHFDRVTLGMYRHGDHLTTTNTAEEADLLNDFGSLLKTGGTELTIVPEIQRCKFAKTFWNVAFSSFATLTNSPLTAIFRPTPNAEKGQCYTPYVAPITEEVVRTQTLPVIEAILKEMVQVGRAMGFQDEEGGLPSDLAEKTIASTAALHRDPAHNTLPSMLLDYRNATPIEVEVIVGEVVKMARERNVPVPRIETLYALLTVIQNQILGGFRTPSSQ